MKVYPSCLRYRHLISFKWLMFVFFVVQIFFSGRVALSATYYVDATAGNDANNGTSTSTPWKTIDKIRSFGHTHPFLADDQILLKAGETWSEETSYWENLGDGSPGHPIIFGKYGSGADPIINTTGPYALSFRDMSYWTIQDIGFKGGTLYQVLINAQSRSISGIKIQRCTVEGAVPGAGQHGIRIDEGDTYTITNIEIANCTIKNIAAGVGNCDGINAFKVTSGLYIHDNLLYGNGDAGQGIDVAGGSDHVIERNIGYGQASLIKCHGQQHPLANVIVRQNIFYGPLGADTMGIAVHDSTNGKVYNNTIYMADYGYGAFIAGKPNDTSAYSGTEIKNNIFYGSRNSEGAFRIDNITKEYFESNNSAAYNNIFSNNYLARSVIDVLNITNSNWASVWAPYHVGDINSNPLFNDASSHDFTLQATSPVIDAGVDLSITSDYAGNPIYGPPDMGAYEYQPPYTMGVDKVPISAAIRTYGNEKFRRKSLVTGNDLADLTIVLAQNDTTHWLDISINTWETTAGYGKNWTESTTGTGLGESLHTIGDLEANKNYNVTVDGVVANLSGCKAVASDYVCRSDHQGKINFTYSGSYSGQTFAVEQGDNTAPTIPTGLGSF